MLNSKTCREHASKCTQTAVFFPPGEQRQKFLDMAEDWTRLGASIEDLEASLSQPLAMRTSRIASAHESMLSSAAPPSARKKLPRNRALVPLTVASLIVAH